jgi:hypothetical protein
MRKRSPESLLQKSKLRTAYRDRDFSALRESAEKAYAGLLAENDFSNKMLAAHLRTAILPAVAFYRVLSENGRSKEEALRLIRASVLDAAQPMARFFQKAGRLPFFFSLLRVLCPASAKWAFGDAGWDFVWKRNDGSAIEWDCRACFYAEVLRGYGMPELTEIFCESDDIMYGRIPGVRWGRTRTIGMGADICDFRFYNQKKERPQNGKRK